MRKPYHDAAHRRGNPDMLIGVAGALPARPADMSPADVHRLAALGFQGVSVPLGAPGEASRDDLQRARTIVTDAGLAIAQANGAYGSLVARSAADRRRGIDELITHMHATKALGARTCYVRPGGLNPRGPWFPHPEHHLDATFDRALDSLRAAAGTAEELGVVLAFEGHVLSVIDRPERVAEILKAIDSPALTFNLDPVNFIGSIWDAWRADAVFDRLLAGARGRIMAAHWKDFTVREELVLHIDEVTPGQGVVDHARWLRRFYAAQPQAWVLLEHLALDQLAPAKLAVDSAMARAGLSWDSVP